MRYVRPGALARDLPREPSFAQGVGAPRGALPVPLAEPLRERPSARWIHAHVERPSLAEGEAARRIVELRRGDAEVHQRAVHLAEPEPVEHRARVAEVPVRDDDVAPRQPLARRLERRRILIEAHHPRARLQERERMPAAAERSVEDQLPRRSGEQRNRLLPEDGAVDELAHLRSILTFTAGAIAKVASSTLRKSARSPPPAALRMLPT